MKKAKNLPYFFTLFVVHVFASKFWPLTFKAAFGVVLIVGYMITTNNTTQMAALQGGIAS